MKRVFLLLLVSMSLLTGCLDFDGPKPDIPTPPTPVVPIENNAITDAFEGDVELAVEIAGLADDFADLIDENDSVVLSTEDIRLGWSRAGRILVQRKAKGKHPDLARVIDQEIAGAIGKQVVSLSEEKRASAVKVFRHIASSARGVK